MFLSAQVTRQKTHMSVQEIQSKLKEISNELDKVSRGDDRYLELLTQEHRIIRDEDRLVSQLSEMEELERSYFQCLSSALRESHEKERIRTERTKYWSLTGSVIGVVLGIIGTSLNNYLKMKELRHIVRSQAEEGKDTRLMVEKLSNSLASYNSNMTSLLRNVNTDEGMSISDVFTKIPVTSSVFDLKNVEERNDDMKAVLCEIREVLKHQSAAAAASQDTAALARDEQNVVEEVTLKNLQLVVQDSEKRIESKMKTYALYTTSAVCATFSIAMLPVCYYLFGSS